jgi:tetratricopeptide (TPR) repeat protein
MRKIMTGTALLLFFTLLRAPGQESNWDTAVDAGRTAMARGEFANAEKSFREALPLAEKLGEKDVRLGGTYLFLAQACESQSRKEEAEALAGRGVEAMEKALAAIHPKKLQDRMVMANDAAAFFDQIGDIFASHHKGDPDPRQL